MFFWDSHLHLPVEDDLHWNGAGFAGGVICATKYSEWQPVLDRCYRSGGTLRYALGIHPWYISPDMQRKREVSILAEYLEQFPKSMVGEIGLDGTPGRPPLEAQIPWFVEQLELAGRFQRVAVVHLVRCWQTAIDILEDFSAVPVVIHGFHGSWQVAHRLLQFPNLQLSIGFDALNCGKNFREALEKIPQDRLLVESDWPFRKHSPDELSQVIDFLARLRGEDPWELAGALAVNSQRAFNIEC